MIMRCPELWSLLAVCLLVGVLADQHGHKWCKPCKKVGGDGPLAGAYYLLSDSDNRCEDGCSYQKGEKFYCFVPGYETIEECAPEMIPVTFMPPGSDAPPNNAVKCGQRRAEGECIKDGRIVNGQEAGCNEWPWQVGIVSRSGNEAATSPFCGGTLINENHVITAAHCMPGKTPDNVAIMIGDHDLNNPEPAQRAYGVSAIYNHPQYDDDSSQHDITVLRLSVKVNTTKYSPACFPNFESGQSLHGENGTISGWGALDYGGDYPDTLQEVQNLIPIVNRETCVTDTEPWIYESDILDGMLCAGGPDVGMDTCQGDSGGPLTHEFADNQYELVGVVSWGRNCAKSYGVYSDVAYYKDWIAPITGHLYMTPSS